MRSWSVTATCTALFALSLAPAAPCQSSSTRRHRLFWEATLGGLLSDNAYRDSRQEGAQGYDLALRTGLRSRFSRETVAQILYDLRGTGFRTADVENRTAHGLRASLRHVFAESLTAELAGSMQLSRFPNLEVFDSTVYSAEGGLRKELNDTSTLGGSLNYEKRSYPDYDLDYTGAGASAFLDRELGRRTRATFSLGLQRNGYSERTVAGTTAGPESEAQEELRTETDWVISADLMRDLSLFVRLGLDCEVGGVTSNADAAERAGAPADGLPDDERVLGDYFSHHRRALGARLRWLIRRGSSLTLAARYVDRTYTNRLATDEEQIPLDPEERRHDRVWRLSATWDVPLPRISRRVRSMHPGLRFRFVHETSRSNETLYHYSHNSLAILLTTWH